MEEVLGVFFFEVEVGSMMVGWRICCIFVGDMGGVVARGARFCDLRRRLIGCPMSRVVLIAFVYLLIVCVL